MADGIRAGAQHRTPGAQDVTSTPSARRHLPELPDRHRGGEPGAGPAGRPGRRLARGRLAKGLALSFRVVESAGHPVILRLPHCSGVIHRPGPRVALVQHVPHEQGSIQSRNDVNNSRQVPATAYSPPLSSRWRS
jgi:hypothetical protein